MPVTVLGTGQLYSLHFGGKRETTNINKMISEGAKLYRINEIELI